MTVTITGTDDLADILKLLHDLTKTQFTRLGLELGLLVTTLNDLATENYGMHVLVAWLQQSDNVYKRGGPPTWNRLIGALQAHYVDGKVQIKRIQDRLKRGILLSQHWCGSSGFVHPYFMYVNINFTIKFYLKLIIIMILTKFV